MATILVVDDEWIIAEQHAELVRAQGHTARIAYNLQEATAIFDEGGIAAIISDFSLGNGETGADLQRHTRGRVPFMIVSAYDRQALAEQGFDIDARDVLYRQKPVTREFSEAVRELIEKAQCPERDGPKIVESKLNTLG